MQVPSSRSALWSVAGLAGSVVSITVLHYTTSLHSVLRHEVFQRLYYLPIENHGGSVRAEAHQVPER